MVFSKRDQEVYEDVVPEYFPGPPAAMSGEVADGERESSAEKADVPKEGETGKL